MQLNQVSINYFSDEEKIQKIEVGILYYVYSGRNAWHSTWITRYTLGCMHTNFESAKAFVERERVQGSLFYIQKLPSLIIEGTKNILYVTQINSNNPLCGYSSDAVTAIAPKGYVLVDNCQNNYLKKDSLLQNVVLSFNINSRFWKERPPLKNSILLFRSLNHESYQTEDGLVSNLNVYKSISHGKKFLLSWRTMKSSISSEAILQLYKESSHQQLD